MQKMRQDWMELYKKKTLLKQQDKDDRSYKRLLIKGKIVRTYRPKFEVAEFYALFGVFAKMNNMGRNCMELKKMQSVKLLT